MQLNLARRQVRVIRIVPLRCWGGLKLSELILTAVHEHGWYIFHRFPMCNRDTLWGGSRKLTSRQSVIFSNLCHRVIAARNHAMLPVSYRAGYAALEPYRRDALSFEVREAIRRFCDEVLTEDHGRLGPVLRDMDRLDCWAEAIEAFAAGPGQRQQKAEALLSFWYTYGLRSIPEGLKENLPCLLDAFRQLLPPYTGTGLVLYRGELASRYRRGICGISWTPNIETARRFAHRRSLIEGKAVVLKIQASPDVIVIAVRDHSDHTLALDEDEYLVDPRQLAGKILELP